MDKQSLAHLAHPSTADQEHEGREELMRSCFYCLEGWVFLGSLDHDGGRWSRPSAAGGATPPAGRTARSSFYSP